MNYKEELCAVTKLNELFNRKMRKLLEIYPDVIKLEVNSSKIYISNLRVVLDSIAQNSYNKYPLVFTLLENWEAIERAFELEDEKSKKRIIALLEKYKGEL